jgi:ribosomal protein S30
MQSDFTLTQTASVGEQASPPELELVDELEVVVLELVEPLSPQPTADEKTAIPPRVRPRITFDKRIATSYDDTLRKKNARAEILAPERFDHPAALERNLAPARPLDRLADARAAPPHMVCAPKS